MMASSEDLQLMNRSIAIIRYASVILQLEISLNLLKDQASLLVFDVTPGNLNDTSFTTVSK